LDFLSWKYVFCSYHRQWDGFDMCVKHVKNSGYKYFTWMEYVYKINEDGKAVRTYFKRDNIKC
jgi:hypothetical protein